VQKYTKYLNRKIKSAQRRDSAKKICHRLSFGKSAPHKEYLKKIE
jgi:hypothetical protein